MPATGLRAWIVQAWKDRPRRRQMIVTDITRMEGNRVCVGGYLEDGSAVRPVAGRAGPDERWLQSARGGSVEPFSVVELRVNRIPKSVTSPHTEDRMIHPTGHRVVSKLSDAAQLDLLRHSLSPTVRSIFGAQVHADPDGPWGRYVRAGEGTRSLGTIEPRRVHAIRYAHYPERGRWDYRLRFADGAGEEFQLAVVDLAFRRTLDGLRDDGHSPAEAAAIVRETLLGQAVYLRIGLARGWERHPDRCYLQITGVYGFARE